jgi:hypothetical protein
MFPLRPNRTGQALGHGPTGAQVTFNEGLFRARPTGRGIAPTDAFGYLMRGMEGVLVSLARRKSTLRTRPAGRGLASLRSLLTSCVVALSLIVQLFAAATPPALAAPAFAGADDAAIAAELKAVFGDAAELCVHINNDGVPGKHAPSGHCCDQCPLCPFAAQAVAFVPPDAPAGPERLVSDAHAIRAPPSRDAVPANPAQPNSARAPPLSV